METYRSEAEYLDALRERSAPPEGFRFAVVRLEFRPAEKETVEPLRMDLSAALLDEPTESFAGVFTRNRYPGAPILVAKERMKRGRSGGVLVNNRIANVCASGGREDAERVASRCATLLGGAERSLFVASTGIIGWRIPVDAMIGRLEELVGRLGVDGPFEMSRAIMTTDSYPKLRSRAVGSGRIVGVAKGAGMIEPDMATLLVFLFTDVCIDRPALQRSLERAVEVSFNTVSIDGDQSTSDMALAFSSNRAAQVAPEVFEDALTRVCRDLALDVVRNGEGTEHVIRVLVESAPDEVVALRCGKAIINSPLVKTAVCGNDPNVGRIVMAVGDYLGSSGVPVDPAAVRIAIGDEVVFSDGVFHLDPEKERRLAEYLESRSLAGSQPGYPAHDRTVDIRVDLAAAGGTGVVAGSDLTHGYVSENADYRS